MLLCPFFWGAGYSIKIKENFPRKGWEPSAGKVALKWLGGRFGAEGHGVECGRSRESGSTFRGESGTEVAGRAIWCGRSRGFGETFRKREGDLPQGKWH